MVKLTEREKWLMGEVFVNFSPEKYDRNFFSDWLKEKEQHLAAKAPTNGWQESALKAHEQLVKLEAENKQYKSALEWLQENIDSAYTIENIEKAKAFKEQNDD